MASINTPSFVQGTTLLPSIELDEDIEVVNTSHNHKPETPVVLPRSISAENLITKREKQISRDSVRVAQIEQEFQNRHVDQDGERLRGVNLKYHAFDGLERNFIVPSEIKPTHSYIELLSRVQYNEIDAELIWSTAYVPTQTVVAQQIKKAPLGWKPSKIRNYNNVYEVNFLNSVTYPVVLTLDPETCCNWAVPIFAQNSPIDILYSLQFCLPIWGPYPAFIADGMVDYYLHLSLFLPWTTISQAMHISIMKPPNKYSDKLLYQDFEKYGMPFVDSEGRSTYPDDKIRAKVGLNYVLSLVGRHFADVFPDRHPKPALSQYEGCPNMFFKNNVKTNLPISGNLLYNERDYSTDWYYYATDTTCTAAFPIKKGNARVEIHNNNLSCARCNCWSPECEVIAYKIFWCKKCKGIRSHKKSLNFNKWSKYLVLNNNDPTHSWLNTYELGWTFLLFTTFILGFVFWPIWVAGVVAWGAKLTIRSIAAKFRRTATYGCYAVMSVAVVLLSLYYLREKRRKKIMRKAEEMRINPHFSLKNECLAAKALVVNGFKMLNFNASKVNKFDNVLSMTIAGFTLASSGAIKDRFEGLADFIQDKKVEISPKVADHFNTYKWFYLAATASIVAILASIWFKKENEFEPHIKKNTRYEKEHTTNENDAITHQIRVEDKRNKTMKEIIGVKPIADVVATKPMTPNQQIRTVLGAEYKGFVPSEQYNIPVISVDQIQKMTSQYPIITLLLAGAEKKFDLTADKANWQRIVRFVSQQNGKIYLKTDDGYRRIIGDTEKFLFKKAKKISTDLVQAVPAFKGMTWEDVEKSELTVDEIFNQAPIAPVKPTLNLQSLTIATLKKCHTEEYLQEGSINVNIKTMWNTIVRPLQKLLGNDLSKVCQLYNERRAVLMQPHLLKMGSLMKSVVLLKSSTIQAHGFFHDNVLYTCQHVAAGLDDTVHVNGSSVKVIYESPHADFAHCSVAQPGKSLKIANGFTSGMVWSTVYRGSELVIMAGTGYLANGYLSHDISLVNGDSGAPIFNRAGELIAMHIGANGNCGWALDIHNVKDKTKPIVNIFAYSPLRRHAIYLDENGVLCHPPIIQMAMENVKKDKVYSKEVRESVDFKQFGLKDTGNYRFSFPTIETQKKDFAKYNKVIDESNLNEEFLQFALVLWINCVRPYSKEIDFSMLTLMQAIEVVDKQTSCGYPANLVFKNKQEFFDDVDAMDYLVEYVKRVHAGLFHLIQEPSWLVSNKIEMRPKEKLNPEFQEDKIPAIRTFHASDICHHLIYVMHYYNFDKWIASLPFYITSTTIGNSNFYGGWHAVVDHMSQYEKHYSVDMKRFDSSQGFKIRQAADKFRRTFVGEEYAHVKDWLFTTSTVSLCFFLGALVWKWHGQCSGAGDTLTMNSSITRLNALYTFIHWCYDNDHDVYEMLKDYGVMCQGDDLWIATRGKCDFKPSDFRKYSWHTGLECDDTPDTPQNVFEVEFISTKTIRVEIDGVCYYFPEHNIDKAQCSMRFTKTTDIFKYITKVYSLLIVCFPSIFRPTYVENYVKLNSYFYFLCEKYKDIPGVKEFSAAALPIEHRILMFLPKFHSVSSLNRSDSINFSQGEDFGFKHSDPSICSSNSPIQTIVDPIIQQENILLNVNQTNQSTGQLNLSTNLTPSVKNTINFTLKANILKVTKHFLTNYHTKRILSSKQLSKELKHSVNLIYLNNKKKRKWLVVKVTRKTQRKLFPELRKR